ncbi:3-phosphoinositide dependent protein kinase-1 [Paramecium bursaria]
MFTQETFVWATQGCALQNPLVSSRTCAMHNSLEGSTFFLNENFFILGQQQKKSCVLHRNNSDHSFKWLLLGLIFQTIYLNITKDCQDKTIQISLKTIKSRTLKNVDIVCETISLYYTFLQIFYSWTFQDNNFFRNIFGLFLLLPFISLVPFIPQFPQGPLIPLVPFSQIYQFLQKSESLINIHQFFGDLLPKLMYFYPHNFLQKQSKIFQFYYMFHLCDCDTCQNYEQMRDEFFKFQKGQSYLFKNEEELFQLISIGLNPISQLLIQRDQINSDIKFKEHLSWIVNFQKNLTKNPPLDFKLLNQYSQIDFLYGWDFLLKYYELNDERHFNIFKEIVSIDAKNNQGLFGDVVITRFEYYVDYLIKKLKEFEKKLREYETKSKATDIQTEQVFQFRLKQFSSFFQQIEKIFMNENYKPKESKEDQTCYSSFYFHQLLLSALNKKQNLERINSPFYKKFLEQKGIEFQGLYIFMQFDRCHELWEVFYLNLRTDQKINIISTIIQQFVNDFYLPLLKMLLLLAKKMKRMKEYYLSFVLFSMFRRVHSQNNQQEYMPYVYYQMGKLCLYLKQYNEAFELYTNKQIYYKKSENLTLYTEKHTEQKFRQKILMKIILVSIFTDHKDTRKIAIEMFMNDHVINKNQQEKLKYTKAPSSQAQFVSYLSDLFHQTDQPLKELKSSQYMQKYCSFIYQTVSLTIPTRQMQSHANCIELKEKNLDQKCESQGILHNILGIISPTRNSVKDKGVQKSSVLESLKQIQLPQECNIFNNYLQLQILINTNFPIKNNALEYNYYFSNQERITVLLQQMNQALYECLAQIFKECDPDPQERSYEKFLRAHMYMYIRKYEEAIRYMNESTLKQIQSCCSIKLAEKRKFLIQFSRMVAYLNKDIDMKKSRNYLRLYKQHEDADLYFDLGYYCVRLFLKQQKVSQLEKALENFKKAIDKQRLIVNDLNKNKYFSASLIYIKQLYLKSIGNIPEVKTIDQFMNIIDELEHWGKNQSAVDESTLNNTFAINNTFDKSEYIPIDRSQSKIQVFDIRSQSEFMQESSMDQSILIQQKRQSFGFGESKELYLSHQDIQVNQGYLQELQFIINKRNQNQNIQLTNLIKQLISYQGQINKMDQDITLKYKFKKSLFKQIELYEKDGQYFALKKISITDDKGEEKFLEQLQYSLQEILCLLKIQEMQRIEFCQIVEFKYEQSVNNVEQIEFFILMKYYEGSINDKMDDQTIIQMMDAIRIMNENHIYHMDLKPNNILYQDNHPVIIDFGSAIFNVKQIVYKGEGQTEGYFNMESEYDKTDIYSFGCILYQLLSGCQPKQVQVDQTFKEINNLELIQDLRLRRIIELATLPYEQRPSMITLRLLM